MTFGNYDDYVRTSVLYYGISKWIVQECIYYKLTMVILILHDRTYATYMYIFRQYLQWQLQVKIIDIMMSLHKIPIVGYDWHNEISE